MVRKSKKKRSSSIHIITVLFTAVCLIYIYRYFAFKIDTVMVKYDTMENTITAQAVLIKTEWSVALPVEAEADYKVNEGDRVSVGKEILKISKSDGADENISLKIAKINERIEEIKKAEEDNNFFAADKQKLEASIQNKVSELKTAVEAGAFSKLEGIKSELSADVYKKSLISGSDSFSGQNLEQLLKEKAALEQIQKNNSNIVYAMAGGVVSYELDGYEEVLRPENIKALKAVSILEILDAFKGKSRSKNDEQEKSQGVKVVDNFEWYVAAVIPKKLLTEDDIGKTIKVRFKDKNDTVISGVLKHFEEGNEQGNLVVIKTAEQLKDFQRIRVAEVEIITKSKEGLIIPSKCIIEKEGQKGVFIERSGIVRFVPLKIAITNEDEVLVENLTKDDEAFSSKNYVLKPFDRVITSTNKVKEEQMLPGAF